MVVNLKLESKLMRQFFFLKMLLIFVSLIFFLKTGYIWPIYIQNLLPFGTIKDKYASFLTCFYYLNTRTTVSLVNFQPDLRINRACTASACMGLISPRDFVDVVLTKETDSYISTNGKKLIWLLLNVLLLVVYCTYRSRSGHLAVIFLTFVIRFIEAE